MSFRIEVVLNINDSSASKKLNTSEDREEIQEDHELFPQLLLNRIENGTFQYLILIHTNDFCLS